MVVESQREALQSPLNSVATGSYQIFSLLPCRAFVTEIARVVFPIYPFLREKILHTGKLSKEVTYRLVDCDRSGTKLVLNREEERGGTMLVGKVFFG